jgi:flagellar basal body-associated protein FliL
MDGGTKLFENKKQGQKKLRGFKLRAKLLILIILVLCVLALSVSIIVNLEFRKFVTNNLLTSTSQMG